MADFIEKIKFNENFAPFKKDDEILFGGEEQIQKLIEFYLKNKKVKNAKENSERFKINCVLGNNGGGKSRLFEGIISKKKVLIYFNDETKCSLISNLLLDNFFIFDSTLLNNKTVHEYLFENYKNNRNNDFVFYHFNKVFLFNYFYELEYGYSLLNIFLNKKISGNYTFSNYGGYLNDLTKIFKHKGLGYKYDDNFEDGNDLIDIRKIFINESFSYKFGKYSGNENIGIIAGKLLKNIGTNNNIYYMLIKLICHNILQSKFRKNYIYNLIKLEKYDIIDLKKLYVIICDKFLSFNIKNEEKYLNDENFVNNLLSALNKLLDKANINFSEKIEFISFLGEKIFYVIDVFFDDGIRIKNLSAGEKIGFLRFTNIYMKIIEEVEKGKKDFTILIDEPDLHLHLDWQKKYIQKLIDVFSTLDEKIKLHFIIATHSPFIISDLPSESIILLDKKQGKEYTKIKTYDGKKEHKEFKNLKEFDEYKQEKKTFGANFVDIINDGFFFDKKLLMGSFAEKVIGELAELERKDNYDNDGIKSNIGNDFLKKNLIYFKLNKGEE